MGVGVHRCIVGIPSCVDHLSAQLVGGLSSHLVGTTIDVVREWKVFHIRLDRKCVHLWKYFANILYACLQ